MNLIRIATNRDPGRGSLKTRLGLGRSFGRSVGGPPYRPIYLLGRSVGRRYATRCTTETQSSGIDLRGREEEKEEEESRGSSERTTLRHLLKKAAAQNIR